MTDQKPINTKLIDTFFKACEQKLAQHEMMVTISGQLSASSKTLQKAFAKLQKSVQKQTTFSLFYQARSTLETKTLSQLGTFSQQIKANLKETKALLKNLKKPFEK